MAEGEWMMSEDHQAHTYLFDEKRVSSESLHWLEEEMFEFESFHS
jgi:hypothetical protein